MTTAWRAAAPLLSFIVGAVSAFLGVLLGDHGTSHLGNLVHLPHQLLIAVPLALMLGMTLRCEGRELLQVAAWAGLGLVCGAALLLLA